MSNLNFIVYSNQDFEQYNNKNIVFKSFGDSFQSDLENALFLITTAGHQLLSEAISINIPLYLIPLDTYEQNYNALMIEKYNLGKLSKKINKRELSFFYNNLKYYSDNIKKFKSKYYKQSWENILGEILKNY